MAEEPQGNAPIRSCSRGPCKGHSILWGHRWGVWFSPRDLSVPGHREALFLSAFGTSVAMSRPPMPFQSPSTFPLLFQHPQRTCGDWCDHLVFKIKLTRATEAKQVTQSDSANGGLGQNWNPEPSLLRPMALLEQGPSLRASVCLADFLEVMGWRKDGVPMSPRGRGSPSSGRIALAPCPAALCLVSLPFPVPCVRKQSPPPGPQSGLGSCQPLIVSSAFASPGSD